MAENRKAGAALAISIPAAIAAAVALAKKTPPGGELVLPKEFVELIIAIASSSEAIGSNIQEIIQELSTLSVNVQGWPPNVKYVRTFVVQCIAAGTPYQASQTEVPSGMNLVIKSYPLNAPGSLIQIATSAAECLNPNSSYPLIPNEAIAYSVQNAKEFYVSTNVAGSIAVFTAERKE